MPKCFDAHSDSSQELRISTLCQLLVEGEQSSVTEYDLESLINELDSEEKKSSAQ
ncbi:type II toxin-antitoxin system ParD family antitoxin [Idiomarina zobellii]|uniref:type II toxin-antitoxin system ParD family antitoxin n=1 Tax=Idiomarina zobellii TaxID=86103 RepID=UPI000881AD1B|nr:antitoxin ParD1/3/4 [Idiomarina zobellii]